MSSSKEDDENISVSPRKSPLNTNTLQKEETVVFTMRNVGCFSKKKKKSPSKKDFEKYVGKKFKNNPQIFKNAFFSVPVKKDPRKN